jgi:Transcriptional regulator
MKRGGVGRPLDMLLRDDIKNRIIQESIRLFNEFGYETVSMRDIAGCLQISPGNLTYHFKKKTDILYAVIDLLAVEHKDNNYSTNVTLAELNTTILNVIQHQKRYVFYYRDITELRKKYPVIAQIQQNYKIEFQTLLHGIFLNFERLGWVKTESQQNQYSDLSVAVLAVMTFWAQLNYEEDNWNMRSVVWSIIRPNLTEEGERQYNKILLS